MTQAMVGRPSKRATGLLVQSVGDDVVIYDQDADVVSSLTGLDAQVWNALDGERTVEQLAEVTGAAEDAVASSLVRFHDASLLADGAVSRRTLMRKIAVGGALVGVAGLASVIAPTAAMAASGGIPGSGVAVPYVHAAVTKKGKTKFLLVVTATGLPKNKIAEIIITDSNAASKSKTYPALTDNKGAIVFSLDPYTSAGTTGTLTITVKVLVKGTWEAGPTTTVPYSG